MVKNRSAKKAFLRSGKEDMKYGHSCLEVGSVDVKLPLTSKQRMSGEMRSGIEDMT